MKMKPGSLSLWMAICLGNGVMVGGGAIHLAMNWGGAKTIIMTSDIALAIPTIAISPHLSGYGVPSFYQTVAGMERPIELRILGDLGSPPNRQAGLPRLPATVWHQADAVLYCGIPKPGALFPIPNFELCHSARYRQPVIQEHIFLEPGYVSGYFPIGENSFAQAVLPARAIPDWGVLSKTILNDLLTMKASSTQIFAARIKSTLKTIASFLANTVFAFLVMAIFFPPLMAVLPAVWLARKKRDHR